MKRNVVTTLGLACVIGLTAGVGLATLHKADRVADEPSASADEPSASAEKPDRFQLLYAADGMIHDDKRAVRYDSDIDQITRLVRVADGYLLSETIDIEEDTSRIFHVTPDGRTSRIAAVVGNWDVDPTGKLVVGVDRHSGAVSVVTIGQAALRTWRGWRERIDPVFLDDGRVLVVTPRQDDGSGEEYRTWNPSTGEVQMLDVGISDLGASLDGRVLVGSVTSENLPGDADSAHCTTADPDGPGGERWFTCDWRIYSTNPSDQISPDGAQLLVVDALTDGFGPGGYDVIGTATGPGPGQRSFRAPALTMDAKWLDDESLVLRVAEDTEFTDDSRMALQRCDLDGNCTRVARSERGLLVVGEQG